MRIPRRAVVISASSLMAISTLIGLSAGAASAQDHSAARASSARPQVTIPSNCPSGAVCTYANTGFSGTQWNFPYNGYQHDFWIWVGGGANDKISSIVNYRALPSVFGKDKDPNSNNCFTLSGNNNNKAATAEIDNLGPYQWFGDHTTYDNSISSILLESSDYEQSCS
jgi:hypothetical protein